MSRQGGREGEVLVVRGALSTEDVLNNVVRLAAKEGWRPGAHDHECFFAADPSGVFIGELGTKPISCILLVKFNVEYAILSSYIVEKAYRGRGYGMQTWKVAMDSLPKRCNVRLDADERMVSTYEKNGFKRAWFHQRFDFTASEAASTFSAIQHPPTTKILPACDVQFCELLAYDTGVHGVLRSSFLEKWISVPSSRSYVATDTSGGITGYAVVRKTLIPEEGWRIGPLLADNAQVARSLYRTIFGSVASEDPAGTIIIDVPFGENIPPDAYQIAANELSGRRVFTFVHMCTKGIPSNLLLHKVFGVTSLETG